MNKYLIQVLLFAFLIFGFVIFYYYSQEKFIYHTKKEQDFLLKHFQINTNLLIFSGFFGCSTVCNKNFQLVKEIGYSFSKEELEIVFLNTDPLISKEDFLQSCKVIFEERITCFYPDKKEFQNFFRNLELPVFKTQNGFEHSSKFLLYRYSDKHLFFLENPDVFTIRKIFFDKP